MTYMYSLWILKNVWANIWKWFLEKKYGSRNVQYVPISRYCNCIESTWIGMVWGHVVTMDGAGRVKKLPEGKAGGRI
jgi:hypothetical protein